MEKIILMNYLKLSKKLELVKEDFIKKLQIYLLSVVLIIIKILKLLKISMLQFKINFIRPLQTKRQLKLYIIEQMVKKKT